MPTYDVRVDAIVRVDSTNFDAAAKQAQDIVKGDIGKPDKAKILDAWVKSVTAGS